MVAPRPTEGVLSKRHEFDVGETHLLDVGDELISQTAVTQILLPGACVNLVNRHGAVVRVGILACAKPVFVVPCVEDVGDDRGRGWGNFRCPSHGVCFLEPVPRRSLDFELVAGADTNAGNEEFPDSGSTHCAHGVSGAIPEIEVTDNAHGLRIGSPHCEGDTIDRSHDTIKMHEVGTQDLPEALMASFGDQIGIHFTNGREEPVGVINDLRMISVGHAQSVVGNVFCSEDTYPNTPVFVGCRVGMVLSEHLDRIGQMVNAADRDNTVIEVCSQHIVGERIAPFGYRIEDVCGHCCRLRFHVFIISRLKNFQ